MRAAALAALLLASPAQAAPSCMEIAGHLATLDARLNRIAANQDADAMIEGAGGLAAGLTFGVSWLATKAATAGLETDPLAAYADYAGWLGAGRALGCDVTMRESARAEPVEITPSGERMDR